MASVLGELGLFKKPVPEKQERVIIKLPDENEGVAIDVAMVDKRSDDFDRSSILARIRKVRVAQVPRERLKAVPKKAAPAQKGPTTVKVKRVRKRPKIKFGKNLLKGTVTAVALPVEKEVDESKSVKVSARRRGKVKVRTRSDVSPSRIKIGDTLVISRLWPNLPKVNLRASAYYMNNRKIFINFINSYEIIY